MIDNGFESAPNPALFAELSRRHAIAIAVVVGSNPREVHISVGGSHYQPIVALGMIEMLRDRVIKMANEQAASGCTCGKCQP